MPTHPSRCNKPCGGDQTQFCGGSWHHNVYQNNQRFKTDDSGDMIAVNTDELGHVHLDIKIQDPILSTEEPTTEATTSYEVTTAVNRDKGIKILS